MRAMGIHHHRAWGNVIVVLLADLQRKRSWGWRKGKSLVNVDCPEDFDHAALNGLSTETSFRPSSKNGHQMEGISGPINHPERSFMGIGIGHGRLLYSTEVLVTHEWLHYLIFT